MEADVVHPLGRTVQAGDDVARDGGPGVAPRIVAQAALARTVQGQQGTAHTGIGGLFQPAPTGTGVAVELEHQRNGPV